MLDKEFLEKISNLPELIENASIEEIKQISDSLQQASDIARSKLYRHRLMNHKHKDWFFLKQKQEIFSLAFTFYLLNL